MELDYSVKVKENKISKAMGRDLNISFKQAVVICKKIKGMKLREAKEILQKTISLKEPLPFPKFNTGIGHRKGKNKIAKYPQKASQEILKVLNNLEVNSEYKGLDPEKLKLIHIQAQRGLSRQKRKPKGRYKLWKTQLVNIQAIAKES